MPMVVLRAGRTAEATRSAFADAYGGVGGVGATVHVVDAGYDTGPVVLRARVPVLAGDTPESLGARVFAAERWLYPAAIRRYVGEHPELFGEDCVAVVNQ